MINKNPFGRPYPLGAILRPGGANFSVYANHADTVELLLFATAEAEQPTCGKPT